MFLTHTRGRARSIAVAASALVVSGLLLMCHSTASADVEAHGPTRCEAPEPAVTAFYDQLRVGSVKDMRVLAASGEAAARVLRRCAENDASATVLERDRLRVRAADAFLVAAVARYRAAQHRLEVADLNHVQRLLSDLDPSARASSNEHLYQEARLLQRMSDRIIGKAPR